MTNQDTNWDIAHGHVIRGTVITSQGVSYVSEIISGLLSLWRESAHIPELSLNRCENATDILNRLVLEMEQGHFDGFLVEEDVKHLKMIQEVLWPL